MNTEIEVRAAYDWRPELARLANAFILGLVSPETRTAYRGDLRLWFMWLEETGLDPHAGRPTDGRRVVRPSDVLLWVRALEERGDASSTRGRRLAAVSSFYGWWACDNPDIHNPVTPLRSAQKPKPRAPGTFGISLTAGQLEELQRVADEHSPRAGALVALLYATGGRISEVLGIMDPSDFDVDMGQPILRLRIKGGKHINHPVKEAAYVRIERLRAVLAAAAGTAVVPSTGSRPGAGCRLFTAEDHHGRPTGRPWSRSAAAKLLGRLGEKIGVPSFNPHNMRRTLITLSDQAGVPLQDIAEAVGHASLNTTRAYLRRAENLDRHPINRLGALVDMPNLPEEGAGHA